MIEEEYSEDAGGELRWGSRGAGLLFRRPSGAFFLVFRSAFVMDPSTWGIPGGKVEAGESEEEAAMREAVEELGMVPPFTIRDFDIMVSGSFRYTTFLASMREQFAKVWKPKLNWENEKSGWFKPGRLPKPLHENVRRVIEMWR